MEPKQEKLAAIDKTVVGFTSEVGISAYSNHFQMTQSTLENLIKDGDKASNEYRETLLLQISYCLLQLQQSKIPCNELLEPSEISIRGINAEKCKELDGKIRIHALANVFRLVLAGKKTECQDLPAIDDLSTFCDDPYTALDFFEKLDKENDFTIEDILKHPFYWSKKAKIDFICHAYEYVSPEGTTELQEKDTAIKYGIDEDEAANNSPKTLDIFQKSWIEALKLSEDEVGTIQRSLRPKVSVNITAIYDLATKKGATKPFNDKLTIHLMRFFRNHHMHYRQHKNIVRLAFGKYIDGYWDFFYKRFPKLFIHVYRQMKSNNVPILLFLEKMALYKNLPKELIHSSTTPN